MTYCESSNAHYAQIQAPAHSDFSGNVTLTLPAVTDTVAGIAKQHKHLQIKQLQIQTILLV